VPDRDVPPALDRLVQVLARRGALDVFVTLQGGALSARALERRLGSIDDSVVRQRLADLRRLGAVEEVPETGDLRLSPDGRRLQDLLIRLDRWAAAAER
jgi:DNA-binding HxlR family transcriptional regulator